MKKTIFLSAILLVLAVSAFGATARSYNQVLGYANGNIANIVTNTSTQPSNGNYLATAYMIARPTEMMSTATQNNTQIRVYQAAGSVMMFVQFGWFPTNWAVGDVLRCRVTLISTGEYTEWEYTITTPSGTITVTNPVQILPAPVYNLSGSIAGTEDLFNVIVSCPTAYLNQSVTTGTDGLFNFIIRYWDSPVITPNKDGYTFTPVDRSYTNVNAAISNANFTIQAAGPVVPPAILVSPADGSTGLGFGLVNLDWEMPVEAASPQGYKVYFDSFSPPTTILTNITNPSTTSYDVFSLNETQTYYWQVVPYIGATNAANCPVWSFTTRSEINPNPATNPIPVNGTTINASSFPYEQNLQWSPPSTGVSPTSYKLSWNGGEPYDVGNVYTTSVTINSAGTYNWQIIPYYYDDGTLSVRAGDPLPARMGCPQNDRGDAVGCPIWSFTIMQAQPMIEEFSNFTGFGLVQVGEFSGYDIMEVSGSNLIGNIIITPPEGFKISTDPNSGYGVSIGLVPDGGTVPNTIIYVRFFPTVPGLASGNIIIASLGAMTLYRELDGTGYDVPVVTNPTYSNVTQTRANLGGNITNINYSTVTERGIYWSTTSGFADGEGDMVSETGSFGTGPFMLNVHAFVPNMTYYFKAFATNDAGTAYSSQAQFSTPPVVINVTNIVPSSNFGSVKVGSISTEGTYTVSSPEIHSPLSINSPTGFQISLTSGSDFTNMLQLNPTGPVLPPITIYVRFAPSATGSFSDNILHQCNGAFNTNVPVSGTGIDVPVIINPTSSNVTVNSAVLGGTITNINYSNVLQRGIYYSTTAGFADGTGTMVAETGNFGIGPFTVNVTDLNTGTTYYFKAFATNAAGTSYTTQSSFTTVNRYTLEITSTPAGANIFYDGVDSGRQTPYTFYLEEGSSALFSVNYPGYDFAPDLYQVTNIQSNLSQHFAGTIRTYSVQITSTPESAYIFRDGVYTGYQTPHQFILDWGTTTVYAVQIVGYYWDPGEFVVNNIQANTSCHFTGTIITYTVDITSTPSGAMINVYNFRPPVLTTPYQFIMEHGSSADYTVELPGYTFSPVVYEVTNINSNRSQHFVGTLLTYTVEITSEPTGVDIYVDGVASGHVTPYTFTMNWGTSATYTVQEEGYTWAPTQFVVNNIQANTRQHFVGELITFTIDITSDPSGATIHHYDHTAPPNPGGGFAIIMLHQTPHTYVFPYGTNRTFYVEKTGYTYAPESFVVNNLTANTSQHFVGTLNQYPVTITSTPTGAAIIVDDNNSGFTTPHTFMMNHGSSAEYWVELPGYNWTPESYLVENISGSIEQHFTGALKTYSVTITSDPTGADILENGDSTEQVTPYTFTLDYGTSTEYTLYAFNYSWTPARLTINNIQSNINQHFVGTYGTRTLSVSSAPVGAQIFINGQNTGFTTPHDFTVNYGDSLTISVSKPGYLWNPSQYIIGSITSDTTVNFIGTLLTYQVTITSNPADADIFINGADSGFNTPYTFTMNWGTSATYTVQKAGYTWAPASFQVNNIQANTSQNFVGTIITYTVDITSTPSGALINIGGVRVTQNYYTPYQFIMNYGNSAVYSVVMPGYTFTPPSFGVNNVQSNQSQHFTGTLNTYEVLITSTPSNSAIYVNGVDSGFFTPHTFVMNWHTSATYTVQKPGYTWAPATFVVTNIEANTSQHFAGTLLTYQVNITSTPPEASIYINGQDSGWSTPHTFTMNWGTSATYTVEYEGYSFNPASFEVVNINENDSQHFVGTILTYTVDVTSSPSGAIIHYSYGYDDWRDNPEPPQVITTPYQFILNYGTSVTYWVEMDGYTWVPDSYYIDYIQSNHSVHFVGTLLTYPVNITSMPTDADIYVNGLDSGFNTPHTFTMDWGTSATYTVQKPGYSWEPANFVVTSIEGNMSQHFIGTMLTYSVTITSDPSDATIRINGQNSEHTTPHTFTMLWGTSATYSVEYEGYNFTPLNFAVNNIQANTSQHFTGTLKTYTVNLTSTPSNAQIWVQMPSRVGNDRDVRGYYTGFNTPHQFVLSYGTNIEYYLVLPGYTWNPEGLYIDYIQNNVSQHFTGSIIMYNVEITSTPPLAAIYVNGQNSGLTTPQTFTQIWGTNVTYTVQKPGYVWQPASFVVNNIQAPTSQHFTGTLLTYTVEITSTPSGAAILINNMPMHYTTPHTFVMDWGTSATYAVQRAGYTFAPSSFVVNNIQSNQAQHFTGLINMYLVNITSAPAGAAIFVNGNNTGFTTPHEFAIEWGSNAIYTVVMPGYTWSPVSYAVNNIQSNQSQHFVGTIITHTVNITSFPIGTDIYVDGVFSGYRSPYTFVMDWGTSAVYSVQKPGYTWEPSSFAVNNIQANTSQQFIGTIITYSVTITSHPSQSRIYVNGTGSSYATPHTFNVNWGTTVTYSVQQEGYTWEPSSYTITNIQENTSQHFIGTIITYAVNVTSSPSGAQIFTMPLGRDDGLQQNGINTGFTTPHVFFLEYGSTKTYFVQMPGYTWTPVTQTVHYIHTNTNVHFTGLIITYTVNITSNLLDTDIYIDGVFSGYQTPHQFVMNWGTSAVYSVQKPGYTWEPANYAVNNIQANASQHFVGTRITYTVNVTSNPSGAMIIDSNTGEELGYTTPHSFVVDWGTSPGYSVYKEGYTWNPAEHSVTNIQSNMDFNFIGTLITYTVDITSTPAGAQILVDGINSGFTTPHQFVMDYGTFAVFSVQKSGYIWQPQSFAVNYIQANTAQHFTGTLLTYTVSITSFPTNARIYVEGIDSGQNTPYVFTMDWGTSAVYSVQRAGYTWNPASYAVNFIQNNQSRNFVGTLQTFTVDITSNPPDADIFVNGIDTGYNTPHQFVLNYGSNAVYTVRKTGYAWTPALLEVLNIQNNVVQHFEGTQNITVSVTSNPSNARIFVNGQDSGFNTPYNFILPFGANAEYTVYKAGYLWTPSSFMVTNIQQHTSVEFIGSLQTFVVNINSVPTGADIYVNGVNSGLQTPNQVVMNYGTNAVYTVQKPVYTWTPQSHTVNNIQANQTLNFTGTVITYTVTINSNPTNADIFISGQDSGFNTPYSFTMNYGSSAVYSVQKPGYNWTPVSYAVNNIQANAVQTFTGVLQTFTVEILSVPADADIYINGQDSGFNTPYTISMNYGSSATYSVKKAGYTWAPANFVVNNIQENVSQSFTGTIITFTVTITSTPGDADIFVNGVDSGFNTPYTFTMPYGGSAVYSVQKAGYSWAPASYAVNNIQANAAQNFNGTLLTYQVQITSTPTNADIYINGQHSGFTTPYTFSMAHGSSATYTVQKAGYTWAPASYTVNNIQANAQQLFTGTQLTYTVNITSNPSDADIFVNGVDSGFNTPRVFILPYGSNAVYTVEKAGYNWNPTSFVVNNIQANAAQLFTGTLRTYTVSITSSPSNADIFVNGVDSGFNTPHVFTLTHGSNAVYTVQKTGYIWSPNNFTVNNIQANASQHFSGVAITLSVTPTTQNVPYLAGTATFNVLSNSSWNVLENVDWLTVSPMNGNGNAQLTVNYDTNPATTPRSGQISVFNGVTTITLNVNQAGAPMILDVMPLSQTVSSQAGTLTLNVTSNITWSVSESITWLSVTPIGGSNNGTVTVTYDANTATVARSGVITISGGNITRAVTITQEAAPFILTVTPANQTVSNTAGTTSFGITSNTAWTVSESVSWLSVTPLSGSNNGTIGVVYSANASVEPRIGQITITGGGITQNVTVTQSGAPAVLNITPTQQYVTNQASTAYFGVVSNVLWTVTEDEDWLSIVVPAKDTNGSFTVAFTANPTTEPRNGTITVSGGGLVRYVYVIQAAGVDINDPVAAPIPMLSVYPNPFTTSAHIKVDVKQGSDAVVGVYSAKGQLIKSLGVFSKGSHTISWDGKDESGRTCSSGFYLIRYKSSDFSKTVKVMYMQ